MTWQPISTAPRDGTWFLISRKGDGPETYEVGCYDPSIWESFEQIGQSGLYRRSERIGYEWRGFKNFRRASHWMPLPEPPEAEP